MMATIIIIMSAAAACSMGRHIQGGAGHRFWAMILYAVVLAPAAWVYVPDWWLGTLRFVLLACGLYLHFTFMEAFGNLWLGVPRYCLGFVLVAAVTGFLPALIGAPLVWLAMKWAKQHHPGVDDEHQVFEYIHGGAAGAAWAAAPLANIAL